MKPKTPAEMAGERIRELREALDLSQEELAGRAKMDAANVSRLENGRSGSRGPTLSVLVQIATALGVAPADLLRT